MSVSTASFVLSQAVNSLLKVTLVDLVWFDRDFEVRFVDGFIYYLFDLGSHG